MKTETQVRTHSAVNSVALQSPARRALRAFFHTDNDVSGLILRLSLAIVMFPHGAQKVLGWFGGYGLTQTLGFFTQGGMPWILAAAVIAAEFLGPIALVLGFFTRWSAFGIGLVMAGAALTVHLQFGFFMNWMGQQKGEGIEYFIPILGIALALMLKGGGRWALDRLIAARIEAGRS